MFTLREGEKNPEGVLVGLSLYVVLLDCTDLRLRMKVTICLPFLLLVAGFY